MDLKSWTRPSDQFSALASCWPDEAIVMAECPQKNVLARAADLPDIRPEAQEGNDPQGETPPPDASGQKQPGVSPWRRGHCIAQSGHVRWRRLGQKLRVVVAGAPDVPEGRGPEDWVPEGWGAPDETRDLPTAEAESREIVLWGRQQPGEALWLELRIPNLMSAPDQHPAAHDEEVRDEYVRRCLQVVTYRDAASGRALYHRYTGITYARTEEGDRAFERLEAAPAS
jgi:hypothetical protein